MNADIYVKCINVLIVCTHTYKELHHKYKQTEQIIKK